MDVQIELNLRREEAEALPYDRLSPPESIELPEGARSLTADFVDPVSIIVTVSIVLITERIVDHWLRSKEQGVMIDLQGEKPRMSHVSGVPAGVLVMINKDGSKDVQHFQHDKRSAIKETIDAVFRKK